MLTGRARPPAQTSDTMAQLTLFVSQSRCRLHRLVELPEDAPAGCSDWCVDGSNSGAELREASCDAGSSVASMGLAATKWTGFQLPLVPRLLNTPVVKHALPRWYCQVGWGTGGALRWQVVGCGSAPVLGAPALLSCTECMLWCLAGCECGGHASWQTAGAAHPADACNQRRLRAGPHPAAHAGR